MWSRLRNAEALRDPRRKILLWATIVGVIFGAIDLGEPAENLLRYVRNAARSHDASGDIVVVAIDDRSAQKLGQWPWPRRIHARLLDRLRELGAKRIFFDINFPARSSPNEDQLFEQALARANGKVVLPVRFELDPGTGKRTDLFPIPEFRKHVALATINALYNYNGAIWNLPYAIDFGGTAYRSFAAELANIPNSPAATFPLDYAIDFRSIPVISAADILGRGRLADRIAGKDVIVGTTSNQFADVFNLPGYGRAPGLYVQVIGAETLKKGTPLNGGWLAPVVLSVALAGLYLFSRRRRLAITAMAVAGLSVTVLPMVLESRLVFITVMPAFFLLLVAIGLGEWTRFRHSYHVRGTVNAVSGLPSLNALRQAAVEPGAALIAARIRNYAEITSSLPPEMEKALVQQIAGRLAVGGAATLYQSDEGVFAWFAGTTDAPFAGEQLDALHGFFRSPISLGDRRVDLAISFGVDGDSERPPVNRLGSALVAADEAAEEGRRWKQYDPAQLANAEWRLSLLGQLDAALDAGDVWVAYQPTLDIPADRLVGAEALVRWTHPEKGEIPPEEFIQTAEQHNRIEKLTLHVLNDAIRAAATINAHGVYFDVAVNLSARLLDNPSLTGTIEALLIEHRLAPRHLTLEVTESAAMTESGRSIAMLGELRALGVHISIDDYGTGFSTLEYLKNIPATEIKIDRSFVSMMDKSQGDRLMVSSTIQLAHSLGRTVVAEGVETPESLSALAGMGCDRAQGFLIGKPMKLFGLTKLLLESRKRAAA